MALRHMSTTHYQDWFYSLPFILRLRFFFIQTLKHIFQSILDTLNTSEYIQLCIITEYVYYARILMTLALTSSKNVENFRILVYRKEPNPRLTIPLLRFSFWEFQCWMKSLIPYSLTQPQTSFVLFSVKLHSMQWMEDVSSRFRPLWLCHDSGVWPHEAQKKITATNRSLGQTRLYKLQYRYRPL